MSRSKAYQKWIDAGYDLFAREGNEGIQIERLARITGLNKSGFYHYFGDLDIYFEHLMLHHRQTTDIFCQEIDTCSTFDPDYLHLLVKHKITVLVQNQLVRNRHIKLFLDVYDEVNVKVDHAVQAIWANFLEIPDQPAVALRYYEMTRHTFFSRVNVDNLTYKLGHEVAAQAKSIIQEMIINERMP